MARFLLAAILALGVGVAHAAEWIVEGRVVGISDGDTITVLDDAKSQHKVWLAGIDAPEKGQAFGDRARAFPRWHMERMPGSSVTRRIGSGATYARCWVQPLDCPRCGKTLDVGLAQISVGLAWWFSRYADEQSAEERGRYKSEEEEARLRKRGLWVDDAPVPPWEWRKRL